MNIIKFELQKYLGHSSTNVWMLYKPPLEHADHNRSMIYLKRMSDMMIEKAKNSEKQGKK